VEFGDLVLCASDYIRVLEHVKYTGYGLNCQLTFDTGNAPKWAKTHFLQPPFCSGELEPANIRLSFRYSLNDGGLLTVEFRPQEAAGDATSVVRILSNYHHPIAGNYTAVLSEIKQSPVRLGENNKVVENLLRGEWNMPGLLEDTRRFRAPLIRCETISDTDVFCDTWSSTNRCFLVKYGSAPDQNTNYLDCEEVVGIWVEGDNSSYFDSLASIFLTEESETQSEEPETQAFEKSYILRRNLSWHLQCVGGDNYEPEKPRTAIENFDKILSNIRSPKFSMDADLIALADQAVARLEKRKDEDIEAWSAELAEEFSKFDD
jgi:hypothetical protein